MKGVKPSKAVLAPGPNKKAKTAAAVQKKEPGGQNVEDEFMDEPQFPTEEISIAVKTVVDNVVGSEVYTDEKMILWNNIIIDSVLTSLFQLQKPFKYIVLSTIMQKSGTGVHSGSSCFWDTQTDGCCTVRWENNYCYVIVTIFGIAFGTPIRT